MPDRRGMAATAIFLIAFELGIFAGEGVVAVVLRELVGLAAYELLHLLGGLLVFSGGGSFWSWGRLLTRPGIPLCTSSRYCDSGSRVTADRLPRPAPCVWACLPGEWGGGEVSTVVSGKTHANPQCPTAGLGAACKEFQGSLYSNVGHVGNVAAPARRAHLMSIVPDAASWFSCQLLFRFEL